MKLRSLWLAVPAILLVCGSCQKKEAPPAAPPAVTSNAAEPVVPATPAAPAVPSEPAAPVVPVLSADQRAAKFGIVGHLPKDTESFITIYNGSKMKTRFKSTKVWELIAEASGMEEADIDEPVVDPVVEPAEDAAAKPAEDTVAKPVDEPAIKPADEPAEDTAAVEEPFSGPEALLGQEVFLATGKGTSNQTGNLITVSRRSNYFQFKLLTKLMLAAAKSNNMDDFSSGASEAQMTSLLEVMKDPQSGIGLFEKMQMPPVYVGFKTLEASREQVAQQVASVVEYMAEADEMVEPVEFERAGAKFSGYRLLGEKIAKSLGEEREEMEKQVGAELTDQYLAAIAKKNLVAASAVMGDYVIVFLGSSIEDCQLVADAKDSLASTDALAFADAYASKELTALLYGSDGMMETLNGAMGALSDLTSGMRDGLAGEEGLGDTRDIESLLALVGEREQALAKLASTDTYGMVSFFEQGLKIETFGGGDVGAIDWKTPSTLASLGNPSDVVLFANFTSDATYDAKAKAYAESLVETAYAMTKKVAEAPIEAEAFKQFKDGMKLFDDKFRADTLTLLDGLRGDLSNGIGNESALVVDLKGSVPAIPGIPQVLVDKGRFIRASWIAPVTDRSKLSSSWDKMNESTTRILKSVSEMAGEDIPMQKPMSSKEGGFTTWFMSLPYCNDDFVPSVTVSDKWFVASSSKPQALELAAAAGKESSTRTGFYLNVKLDPMRSFVTDWMKLVDANSALVFADQESALAEFTDNKQTMEKALVALADFEEITAHVRREGGHLRGSVHFKTH